jgi:hypothetical protein
MIIIFFHIFLWTIAMFFPSSYGLPLFPHLPMDDCHFFRIFLWMTIIFFQSSYGWLLFFPHLPLDDRHFFPIFLWMIVSFFTSFYGWLSFFSHLLMDDCFFFHMFLWMFIICFTSSYGWLPFFFKCFYGWRPLWLFQKITKNFFLKKNSTIGYNQQQWENLVLPQVSNIIPSSPYHLGHLWESLSGKRHPFV